MFAHRDKLADKTGPLFSAQEQNHLWSTGANLRWFPKIPIPSL